MADESVMKITYTISAALVLGSFVLTGFTAHAEETRVGSVELIPFPEGSSTFVNAYFSGDGQLRLLNDFGGQDSLIYSYVDGEWTLIRRELRSVVPGLTPFDVSDDGSRTVLSDFVRVDVLDGPTVFTMPREWTYNEVRNGRVNEERVYGYVWGGSISGDGRVVTMSGRDLDYSIFDSLAWFGGGELINLSADLPHDELMYGAGIPSGDGSVIVFAGSDTTTPPSSNAKIIWRWEDGQLTEISAPILFDDQQQSIVDMSEDGDTVFGNVEGPARGGVSSRELSVVRPWSGPSGGQRIAWVWTESQGSVELIDRSRFLETNIRSVVADGSMALLSARPHGNGVNSQYLWFGEHNFVALNELFHTLNISIDADYYAFNEISDDGTKLMGLASVDGQIYSHAIIVTIPDLTP